MQFGLWLSDAAASGSGPVFVMDTGGSVSPAGLRVVAPQADADRIDALIAAGARQVLLGEAALCDSGLVMEAIHRHGPERIGVWIPVRRGASQWGLDTTSNADFSVVTVANPVPRWLVLREDGSLTDVDAVWWAGQMAEAGCSSVLVSVAAPEDEDLLPCAEMAESLGERFWLNAGSCDVEELRFWVRYGQARRLVLPAGSDPRDTSAKLDQRLSEAGEASCAG